MADHDDSDADPEGPDPEITVPTRLSEPLSDDASIDALIEAVRAAVKDEEDLNYQSYVTRHDQIFLIGVLWTRCLEQRAQASDKAARTKALKVFENAVKQAGIGLTKAYDLRHLAPEAEDIHRRALRERKSDIEAGRTPKWPNFADMLRWHPKPKTPAQQRLEENRANQKLLDRAGEELENETAKQRRDEALAMKDKLIETDKALHEERETREELERQNAALRRRVEALVAELAAKGEAPAALLPEPEPEAATEPKPAPENASLELELPEPEPASEPQQEPTSEPAPEAPASPDPNTRMENRRAALAVRKASGATAPAPNPEPEPEPAVVQPGPEPSGKPAQDPEPAPNVIGSDSRRSQKKAKAAGPKLTPLQEGVLRAVPPEGEPIEQDAIVKTANLRKTSTHSALERLAHLGLIELFEDNDVPGKRLWRRAPQGAPPDVP